MSTTSITVGTNTVTLVSLPPSTCFSQVEFNFSDAVAIVASPYTGQTQAQQWPGADMWSGTVTLPPLTQKQADIWISALMECRGMANAIQIADPLKSTPRGNPLGTPTCPSTAVDAFGSQVLHTVGCRLHRVLDIVNSDSSGNATISIWPSLREAPAASAPIILSNPMGLFRLGTNKRTWSADVTRTSRLSFPITEFR
jgi:hypothetical protein